MKFLRRLLTKRFMRYHQPLKKRKKKTEDSRLLDKFSLAVMRLWRVSDN